MSCLIFVPRFGAYAAAVSTTFAFWCFWGFKSFLSDKVWRVTRWKRAYITGLVLFGFGLIQFLFDGDQFDFAFFWLVIFSISVVLCWRNRFSWWQLIEVVVT